MNLNSIVLDYISSKGGSSPVSFWRPRESFGSAAPSIEGIIDGRVKVHPYIMPPFKLSELESWDGFSVKNKTDCNTHLLKECLPWARFVLLVRNPYDISVSRTFRKNDYRQVVAPGMGDLDYLSTQCNYVSKFYEELPNHYFDFITRYENFVSDPVGHMNDMLMSLKLPSDIGQLKTASALYCNENKIENKSINLNRKPQTIISGKEADIMVSRLSSIASDWGYHIPDYISPKRGSSAHECGVMNVTPLGYRTINTPSLDDSGKNQRDVLAGTQQRKSGLK